jgi:hypothetical protein
MSWNDQDFSVITVQRALALRQAAVSSIETNFITYTDAAYSFTSSHI